MLLVMNDCSFLFNPTQNIAIKEISTADIRINNADIVDSQK